MENWQKRKIERSLKYQTRVFSEHINELVVVNREGKEITLDDGRQLVEFVSCSYLGLETHQALKKAVIDAVDRFLAVVDVVHLYQDGTSRWRRLGLLPNAIATAADLGKCRKGGADEQSADQQFKG